MDFLIRIVFLLLVGAGSSNACHAQWVESEQDRKERIGRTTWHSAVVPGWGQLDNGKWWKVPLVYGALGASGYFIREEGALYRGYRDGYLALTDDDPATQYVTQLTTQQVLDSRDFHRSNLEQSILTFVLLWGVQVVDAHVDAHLKGFDVSENLSFVPGVGTVGGVTLTWHLTGRQHGR